MKRKGILPELLAPAGSFDALVAAIAAGADAVYLGGKNFGARAYAENFDTEKMKKAVEYAHLCGVRLFVTVNTLVYDRELDALSDYVAELYRIGVDAIICADLGVVREIKRRTPDMEIHASTQMSLNNTEGVRVAYELGCTRAVTARELSLEDIKRVVENSPAEIEVFLHGALCVCHSGQCLFSSLVGGRSGNRGECAQPCRLPYNGGKYPLSLSDLSLAGHIRELCDSGVASLKIEGRMKSAEYVYNVTRVYRTLLDEYRDAMEEEEKLLRATFSRGGFTDGYFTGRKFSHMTGVRSDSDKAMTKELEKRNIEPFVFKLRAKAEILRGSPSRLTLTDDSGRSVFVSGEIPSEAKTAPLTAESVKDRLSKMGGTYFSLAKEDIELTLDDGLNLSPAALNALRRDAVFKLSDGSRELADAPTVFEKRRKKTTELYTATFLSAKAYENYLKCGGDFFDIVFLPIEYFEEKSAIDGNVGIALPPVAFDSEAAKVRDLVAKAKSLGVKYALCSNLSHIPLAREYGLSPVGDFRLNISNSEAMRAAEDLGLGDIILHPELTAEMARDIGGGVIVYGRIPLMLTERCFVKENFGCEKCGKAALTDRTGARFPILYEFGHRNLILNSSVTYMGDRKRELEEYGLRHRHFIFSTESASEIADVIRRYKKGLPLPPEVKVRRMGIRNNKKEK